MSMVKLTLNAEPDLIAEAKRLAARRNISLSTLFRRHGRQTGDCIAQGIFVGLEP